MSEYNIVAQKMCNVKNIQGCEREIRLEYLRDCGIKTDLKHRVCVHVEWVNVVQDWDQWRDLIINIIDFLIL
jgi:hypothetical protein